jgi:hypothetical protein
MLEPSLLKNQHKLGFEPEKNTKFFLLIYIDLGQENPKKRFWTYMARKKIT